MLRHRRSLVAGHGCPRRARRTHAARCALRALVHRLAVIGESALGVHVYTNCFFGDKLAIVGPPS
eukprot:2672883-Pleurochrysis_carterae.AAC.1